MKIRLEVLPGASGGGFLLCVLGMSMWDAFELLWQPHVVMWKNQRYFVWECVTCGLSMKSMG